MQFQTGTPGQRPPGRHRRASEPEGWPEEDRRVLAQDRLNSDQTTQVTRTPSCPESEVRTRKAGRVGSCAPRAIFLATIMAEAGVSVTEGSPGVRQCGAQALEERTWARWELGVGGRRDFFSPPGLRPRSRGGRRQPHARSGSSCPEVGGPEAARGPFKVERGRGRGARAVEGASPPRRRDQGRGGGGARRAPPAGPQWCAPAASAFAFPALPRSRRACCWPAGRLRGLRPWARRWRGPGRRRRLAQGGFWSSCAG